MCDSLKTKDRILETAAALFGEHGIHGVSTTDIASKAGVNKALIFYYFGSKEELYRAVFKNWLYDFKKTMTSTLEGIEPGLPMIETFVRTHINLLNKHQNMLRIFIRELLKNENESSPLLEDAAEVLKPFRNNLLVAIATAQKRGEIRDVDLIQTFINIISLDIFFFLGIPILRMVNPSMNSEEFRKNRVDCILDLLMNGLHKQPEQTK